MPHNRKRLLGLAALGLSAMLAFTACSGQAPAATEEAAESSTSAPPLNVGLFVANAFGDHSYYDAAHATIEQLEGEFGATVSTYEGKLETQNYGPLLQDAADANELVYVVGNQAVDAAAQAAAQNPDTTFVFLNGFVPGGDVVSATFRYQENCYAGGTVAALVSADTGATAVGFMGGFESPPMADCEAGLTQGVHAQDESISIVSRYVGSFSEPAKGLETAVALGQAGAHVILAFAGLSAQGALGAVDSGTDIAPIMASWKEVPEASPAILNDDVGVLMLDVAQHFVDGSLERGSAKSYGFAEGAFVVQYNDRFLSAEQQREVDDVIAQIVAGSITPEGAPRS